MGSDNPRDYGMNLPTAMVIASFVTIAWINTIELQLSGLPFRSLLIPISRPSQVLGNVSAASAWKTNFVLLVFVHKKKC